MKRLTPCNHMKTIVAPRKFPSTLAATITLPKKCILYLAGGESMRPLLSPCSVWVRLILVVAPYSVRVAQSGEGHPRLPRP